MSSSTEMRAATEVRVSLSALAANIRRVLHAQADAVIDLRADALGHGVGEVARVAQAVGAHTLLVDDFGYRTLAAQLTETVLMQDPTRAVTDEVYGLVEGFTPVMSLHGWISALKPLRAGEAVSYGYTHRAPHNTVVALVTGGYAQGIVRGLGNQADVLINGSRYPIIGRVAMDACVVDVKDGAVTVGSEVAFFSDTIGGGPALSAWVSATGMTAAELVTSVGLRSARDFTT